MSTGAVRASRTWSRRGAGAVPSVLWGCVVGVVAGSVVALVAPWQAAILIGWDTAALTYLLWTWLTIVGLDAAGTARIAGREDPRASLSDLLIIVAGVACLGAVGLVLVKAASSAGGEKAALIAVGVASVAASWAAVHTVFTLAYARLYYASGSGGIDFNEDDDPDYLDFAYMAFTIGLTFQVSDTNIGDNWIRRTALRHSLLAFLFGAVIVGLTINVVASLLR